MDRMCIRILLAVAAAGCLIRPTEAVTTPEAHAAITGALEAFLARPAIPHEYRASRRLEASGVGQRGWLEAQTSFSPASGFLYEVIEEGGSGFIRSRVLHSLLDEERRLIAQKATPQVALSRANYRFAPEALGADGLAVVSITPLRKERALIDGRIFLTPADGVLMRVEGRLARTPSFWVSRVNVVRTYERINGVVMPVSLQTTAQLRLFGSSSLRMTYHYSQLDDRPVVGAAEPVGPEAASPCLPGGPAC
jgi:hypothetical protein